MMSHETIEKAMEGHVSVVCPYWELPPPMAGPFSFATVGRLLTHKGRSAAY